MQKLTKCGIPFLEYENNAFSFVTIKTNSNLSRCVLIDYYLKHHRSIFFACVLFGLALNVVVGRFPHMDESYFKAAGRQWAKNGEFRGPENAGHFDAELGWSLYPPLYPRVFGVYTKVVGFGYRQIWIFDGLIHSVLILLTALVALRCFGLPSQLLPALAILLLPLGTLGRPDELGVCFGLLSFYFLLKPSAGCRTFFCSSLFLGMGTATSLGVAMAYGISSYLIYLTRYFSVRSFKNLGILGLISIAIFLGIFFLSNYKPIDGLKMMLGWGAGLSKGSAAFWYFQLNLRFFSSVIVLLLVGVIALILSLKQKRLKSWWLEYGTLLVATLALYKLSGGKPTYMWMVCPLLIIAGMKFIWSLRPIVPKGVLVLICCCFALGLVPAALENGLQTYAMVTLPEEQSPAHNQKRLREIIPQGATVLTLHEWWLLAGWTPTLDMMWSKADPNSIDYIVRDATRSGKVGRVLEITKQYEDMGNDFGLISSNLAKKPVLFFGLPITRSGWGFGNNIYKRIQ